GSHTLTAVAADGAGNTSSSAGDVTGSDAPDTTPPTITGVTRFAITAPTPAFRLATGQRAARRIDYGPSAGYGASAADATLVTAHTMSIGGLSAATTYHYHVVATDAAGNVASSDDGVFATPAADTTPPTVSITAPANNAAVSATITVSAT